MYTIKHVSKLAGISTRTLRYYDEIGLFKPTSWSESGYRLYDSKALDQLQHILMYKKLGLSLKDIEKAIHDPTYNVVEALNQHLHALHQKRKQMDVLIQTIEKTILYQKGEIQMTNDEKFEGLKAKQIEDNEKQYGKELRETYGDEAIDQGNIRFQNMSKKDHDKANQLADEIIVSLKDALISNDPQSEAAIKACKLHQKWIKIYWASYSKEAHLALVDMYLTDDRFKAYYERVGEGATKLLNDAMHQYLR